MFVRIVSSVNTININFSLGRGGLCGNAGEDEGWLSIRRLLKFSEGKAFKFNIEAFKINI